LSAGTSKDGHLSETAMIVRPLADIKLEFHNLRTGDRGGTVGAAQ
jgi:hypothetical protein